MPRPRRARPAGRRRVPPALSSLGTLVWCPMYDQLHPDTAPFSRRRRNLFADSGVSAALRDETPAQCRRKGDTGRWIVPTRSRFEDSGGSMTELRVLTVEQVAELVQLSAKTVMRAIHAGDLDASQLT